MTYPNVAATIYGCPWIIRQEKMQAIVAAFEMRRNGQSLSKEEIAAIAGAAEAPDRSSAPGKIAVMPLFGTIYQHGGMIQEASGGTSTEAFGRAFRQAVANPDIATIVMEISSPGGQVYGTPELADLIYRSRKEKRIIASVNSEAASAAYWIGSAASEMYVTTSGEVGSIGVLTMHEDVSKAEEKDGRTTTLIAYPEKKIEGHPYAPLSEEVRETILADIKETYERFVSAVARNRGVGVDAVRSGFGGGGMVRAKAAVAEKMADGVATFAEVIEGELSRIRQATRNRAAARERSLKLM